MGFLSLAFKARKAAVHGQQGVEMYSQYSGYCKDPVGSGTTVAKKGFWAWFGRVVAVWETPLRCGIRALQLILAVVAVSLYGKRLAADKSAEWVFGVAVPVGSGITAILFVVMGWASVLSERLRPNRLYGWDLSLFVLWMAVFAIFASLFLGRADDEAEYKGASTGAMKVAVWIDLTNAVLWLVTGLYGLLRKKLFAGIERGIDKVANKAAARAQSSLGRKEEQNEPGDCQV